jgi:hypothetical protein
MIQLNPHAEFHADPFKRAMGDICENRSILKNGLGDPGTSAGACAALTKWLAIAKAPKWGIELSRAAFK